MEVEVKVVVEPLAASVDVGARQVRWVRSKEVSKAAMTMVCAEAKAVAVAMVAGVAAKAAEMVAASMEATLAAKVAIMAADMDTETVVKEEAKVAMLAAAV